MERIAPEEQKSMALFKNKLGYYAAHAAWEVRRGFNAFIRRFGRLGWCVLLSIAISVQLTISERKQRIDIFGLREQISEKQKKANDPEAIHARAITSSNGRTLLNAFDEHLLPNEKIPAVVDFMLKLAQDLGISMQRGEYTAQVDPVGGFMRYRMNLPLRGSAAAIDRFIFTALHTEKSLALESVQFKREQIDSSEMEVRIQWVAMATLPSDNALPSNTANTPAVDALKETR